jgi:CcmD family protein
METLIATYIVAWAAVSGYVVWLTVANARLARRLERLEVHIGQPCPSDIPPASVA